MSRHVFVSGGTSGIGLGIARVFADAGCNVTVHGRNAEKAATAALTLGGFAVTSDVRNFEETRVALDAATRYYGLIDVLIAAAAGNFPALAVDLSPNGFKAVMDIDLLGTFHLCRAAYPHLRRPGAAILAISANHASFPFTAQAHVCAAKAGVEMLCKTLALEWGPEGVRVNLIQPGPIDGTEGMQRLAPNAEARALVQSQVPLRRMGSVDDVGRAAFFLCSDQAAFITGAVLTVDGGTALQGGGDVIARMALPPNR
jgi:NAD(P)-dependent dehydrogenase (short-subunit alcohol dehydrogenase family)